MIHRKQAGSRRPSSYSQSRIFCFSNIWAAVSLTASRRVLRDGAGVRPYRHQGVHTGGDTSQSHSTTARQRIHKLEPSSTGLAIKPDRGKDAGRDEGKRVTVPMRARWSAYREAGRSASPLAQRASEPAGAWVPLDPSEWYSGTAGTASSAPSLIPGAAAISPDGRGANLARDPLPGCSLALKCALEPRRWPGAARCPTRPDPERFSCRDNAPARRYASTPHTEERHDSD